MPAAMAKRMNEDINKVLADAGRDGQARSVRRGGRRRLHREVRRSSWPPSQVKWAKVIKDRRDDREG